MSVMGLSRTACQSLLMRSSSVGTRHEPNYVGSAGRPAVRHLLDSLWAPSCRLRLGRRAGEALKCKTYLLC
jgi:hypothetical protein